MFATDLLNGKNLFFELRLIASKCHNIYKFIDFFLPVSVRASASSEKTQTFFASDLGNTDFFFVLHVFFQFL